MESLPNIVAAWVGCIGTLCGLGRSAWRFVRNRPRLAQPEFCRHDGHKGVKLANAGRGELDIESVRFEFVDQRGERTRIELVPEREGPIPAKRGIDHNDPAPAWQRFYYFPASFATDVEGACKLGLAATSDRQTWKFEIWVRGRHKPIWSASSDELSELQALLKG